MRNLMVVFVVAVVAFSCNPEAKIKSDDVKSLFEGIKQNRHVAMYQSNQDQVIQFETGSSVVVPAGVLETRNGEAYNGEYQLEFQEIHSVGEIIASGIPMVYEDEKGKGFMTSAGMVDIRAFTESGEELFIREGKSVQLNIASNQAGDDYNLYVFEEKKKIQSAHASLLQLPVVNTEAANKTGKWRLIKGLKPKSNKDKKAIEKGLDESLEEPHEPKVYGENSMVFDFDLSGGNYPDMEAFDGVLWQFAGNPDDMGKTSALLSKVAWKDIKVKKKQDNLYQLTFVYEKGKSYNVLAAPVLSTTEYEGEKVAFDDRLKTYKKAQKKREKDLRKVARMGEYIRSFEVTDFGYFNCDAIILIENQAKHGTPIFTLNGEEIEQFYHIAEKNGRAISIRYTEENSDEFFYYEDFNNKIIAQNDEGVYGTVSPTVFKEMSTVSSVALTVVNQNVLTVSDLDLIIENCE